MSDIMLIGVGNIGSYIAYRLREYGLKVVLADYNEAILNKFKDEFETRKINVLNLNNVSENIKDIEWVLTALPGNIAYEGIKNIILCKRNIVDISFYSQNVWGFEDLVRKMRVLYMPDAGFAPGLSNILAGKIFRELGGVENLFIYVGGLSYEYDNFLGIALTWSTYDLIDEYIRPARKISNYKVIKVDPLNETGLINIPGVGEFEYFISDGLRTLLKTLSSVKNMAEYTIRYKGHIKYMKFLKKLGLLNHRDIIIDDNRIRRSILLKKLLEESIRNRYMDKTILYVYGSNGERESRYLHLNTYDNTNKKSAMAIDTGSIASSITILGLEGIIKKYGIFPPEYIGLNDELYKEFNKIMNKFNIHLNKV